MNIYECVHPVPGYEGFFSRYDKDLTQLTGYERAVCVLDFYHQGLTRKEAMSILAIPNKEGWVKVLDGSWYREKLATHPGRINYIKVKEHRKQVKLDAHHMTCLLQDKTIHLFGDARFGINSEGDNRFSQKAKAIDVLDAFALGCSLQQVMDMTGLSKAQASNYRRGLVAKKVKHPYYLLVRENMTIDQKVNRASSAGDEYELKYWSGVRKQVEEYRNDMKADEEETKRREERRQDQLLKLSFANGVDETQGRVQDTIDKLMANAKRLNNDDESKKL